VGRNADSFREVVCPDTGERFDNVADAVRTLQVVGRKASTEGVYHAIATGEPYCGRHWDFRWPAHWNPARRQRAGECQTHEANA
jgi:hypothetical protein